LDESDSTLFHLIGEMELMENFKLIRGLLLRLGARGRRIHSGVRIRIANLGCGVAAARTNAAISGSSAIKTNRLSRQAIKCHLLPRNKVLRT
jgi:hypothetical protein